jgi:hypothetical protein
VFIESSNELGAFESGAVAGLAGRWLGPVGGTVFSAVSGGVGTILVVGVMALALPELRRLGRLDLPRQDSDALEADSAALDVATDDHDDATSPRREPAGRASRARTLAP